MKKRRDRNYEQTTGTPSALSIRLPSSYPNDRNSDVLSLYGTFEILAIYLSIYLWTSPL